MTAELIVFAVALFGVMGGLMLERMRVRIDGPAAAGGNVLALPSRGRWSLAAPAKVEGNRELRLVNDARFVQRRLLSDNLEQVIIALDRMIGELELDWRVLARVELTEIIDVSDADTRAAISGQCVDLLIVSGTLMPLAAVEYQALGQIREDNVIRAAIKREALRRADIGYIEVRADTSPEALFRMVQRLAAGASPLLRAEAEFEPDTAIAA